MNKNFKAKNDATLFKFKVGENQIVIRRVDNLFYLVQVGDKDKLIGDLMDTAEWLRKYGARWCIGHGKHSKSREFILDRGNAVRALKDGWAVIALDMKTRLSYDEHYESVYNSSGEVVSNVPAGDYAIDFSQSQFKKTYNEVMETRKAEKKAKETKIEARKIQEALDRRIAELKARRAERKTVEAKSEPKAKSGRVWISYAVVAGASAIAGGFLNRIFTKK